jgi:hypothetical protein
MGLEVLTAENIKTGVFWDSMPCNLVEGCCYPEDGGSRYLQNNSNHLPDYIPEYRSVRIHDIHIC